MNIQREARKGRVAYIRGTVEMPTGGVYTSLSMNFEKNPIRVYVKSRDHKWHLQGPVIMGIDGVFVGSAILGRDRQGVYKVVAVQVAGPVSGATALDTLPEGPKSNELRYLVVGQK
jgi:hypothetical protein